MLKWINYLILCCVAFFNLVTCIIDQYVWYITDMPYPFGSLIGLAICVLAFISRNEAFKTRTNTIIKEPNCFCVNLAQQENDPQRITTVY